MRVVDPAVEDGNLDALPRDSRVLHGLRADVRHRLGEIELVVRDPRNAHDRGVRGDLRNLRGVDLDEHGVHDHLHAGEYTRARVDALDTTEESFLLCASGSPCSRLALALGERLRAGLTRQADDNAAATLDDCAGPQIVDA